MGLLLRFMRIVSLQTLRTYWIKNPETELGRQICAAAKTIHGDDSRLDREINRITMQRLRLYALILGVPFRSDAGDKRL